MRKAMRAPATRDEEREGAKPPPFCPSTPPLPPFPPPSPPSPILRPFPSPSPPSPFPIPHSPSLSLSPSLLPSLLFPSSSSSSSTCSRPPRTARARARRSSPPLLPSSLHSPLPPSSPTPARLASHAANGPPEAGGMRRGCHERCRRGGERDPRPQCVRPKRRGSASTPPRNAHPRGGRPRRARGDRAGSGAGLRRRRGLERKRHGERRADRQKTDRETSKMPARRGALSA